MQTFLAFYRGDTIANSKIVEVVADPKLIAEFARIVLRHSANPESDPILHALNLGRKTALTRIAQTNGGRRHV